MTPNLPLRPDADAAHFSRKNTLHQRNIAQVWLRPLLILDPDQLGFQKLARRNVALVVASMVVMPA